MLAFAWVAHSFWAPAHPGVDQNGYLVGGKFIADHLSPGFKPTDPFQFVGWMWIRTDDGWFYPKYPIGLPLLNAIALWLDPSPGDPHGKVWAMTISPICAILALAAMFLMVRLVAGSFLGILGMILLGTSMTTLAVMNSPWSHAPALCFVTWGMYLLLRWWQTAAIWRGALAGFLLGYALTIRYTEGLLLVPMALVIASMLDLRRPRTWLLAAVPMLGWIVPVGLLVMFNLIAMGAWTGYDPTNESTGFTWQNFRDKWEFMAQQIYDYGLFFLVPLAVLGFVLMYRATWKLGLLFTLWFVPGVVIYTAYYWGLQSRGVGYLRFFLTLFPAMIVAACWYMRNGGWLNFAAAPANRSSAQRGAIAAPIACGVIVAIASAVGVSNAIPSLSREHANNWNLAYTMDEITRAIPRGSVVFAERSERGGPGGGGPNQLLNFLQFKGDFVLYSSEAFTPRPMNWRGGERADPDQPTPLQPARRKYLVEEVYRGKSQADLLREQQRLATAALDASKRVFVLLPGSAVASFRTRFLTRASNLAATPVSSWKELVTPPAERNTGPDPLQPQGRGPGPGGGPGSRNPQTWQILELTRRAPTTAPAAAPLSR